MGHMSPKTSQKTSRYLVSKKKKRLLRNICRWGSHHEILINKNSDSNTKPALRWPKVCEPEFCIKIEIPLIMYNYIDYSTKTYTILLYIQYRYMINGLCSSLLLAREPHRPCDSANLDCSKELVVLTGFRPTKPSLKRNQEDFKQLQRSCASSEEPTVVSWSGSCPKIWYLKGCTRKML